MKRKTLLGALTALAMLGSGCAYMHVQMPLDTSFSNTRIGPKTGRASMHSVCWLVAWGDAGAKAAAEEGGLKVIQYADQEYLFVLFGLYSRATCVVYGE